MYLGAMNGISESVVEAAKLDGVTFFGEFIYITFPSIFSTFRSLLIVSIGGIFTNQARLLSFFGTTQAEETNSRILPLLPTIRTSISLPKRFCRSHPQMMTRG
jgi:ABC-type sugar transport system permease subunit